MEKREPATDVPRRIYRSTIERIDKHLADFPKEVKRGKSKSVKGDFNKFLVLLLDTYENLQNAKPFYAIDLYEDISEARGEAIARSVRIEKPVEWPKIVVVMGEDQI